MTYCGESRVYFKVFCQLYVFTFKSTMQERNLKSRSALQLSTWNIDYKNLPRLCTGTGKSTLVSKICNVHNSASVVVDCKSLTLGWIFLSLYKVLVDSYSLYTKVQSHIIIEEALCFTCTLRIYYTYNV